MKDFGLLMKGVASTDQSEAALADLMQDMPPANLGAWIVYTGKALQEDAGTLDNVMFLLCANVTLRRELIRRLQNGAKLDEFCSPG